MKAKIAVLFPGIGYTKNHPLLFYSGKLALEQGYKLKTLEFSGFPHKLKGNREAMMSSFQIAVSQAEEQLKFIDFSAYEDIVFISKSIGTVGAAIYATKHGVCARQLYFTPLEQTFSLVEEGNGLVFHGTDDSWVNTDVVIEAANTKGLTLRTVPNANHSLETKDVFESIAILQSAMKDVDEFLKAGSDE